MSVGYVTLPLFCVYGIWYI